MTPETLGVMVPLVGVFIPIIAILAGIGVAIVVIVSNHRRRLQRAEFRHRERLAALEKGLELPPDPPEGDPRGHEPGRFLRQGLVLIAIGATLTGALMMLPGVPYLFGFIPAAIGIAYLVYYFVHARHQKPDAGAPPAA